MQVLDDLGDRSEPAVREQYFNEIDKDGSGAIDFEEFLAVRHYYEIIQIEERIFCYYPRNI